MNQKVSTEEKQVIRLEGVRTHNLANIDVTIPLGGLTLITGVSGSGKSSLAFDTLHAEGQRRYIDTFSPYSRQFLPQYDKPPADLIDNVPPAIAVGQQQTGRLSRSSMGEAAGIVDFLRLAFARVSTTVCPWCHIPVRPMHADDLFEEMLKSYSDESVTIGFPLLLDTDQDWNETWLMLREEGFVRVAIDGQVHRTDEAVPPNPSADQIIRILLDRLRISVETQSRFAEAVETAFDHAEGQVDLAVGNQWTRYYDRRICSSCHREFPEPEPSIFLWSNPESACPTCKGRGDVPFFDPDKIIPNPALSLAEHGIAPLSTPGYREDLERFLFTAPEAGIPIDKRISELDEAQRNILWKGKLDVGFVGIDGFLQELERQRYKPPVRILLNRYRSYRVCQTCHGERLRPEVLAHQLAGKSFADIQKMTVIDALQFIQSRRSEVHRTGKLLFDQLHQRVEYLARVGVGYLTFDRSVRSLSAGEAKRIALTTALGTGLSKTLFVLDEPTAGLHPMDIRRLLDAIIALRDSDNTVVVVEHDRTLFDRADWIIELGPGAGRDGGEILYEGPPEQFDDRDKSIERVIQTRLSSDHSSKRMRGTLKLSKVTTHNLKELNVEFPLHGICAVAGVSGAGKSSLVIDTLYPAIAHRLGDQNVPLGRYQSLTGGDSIDEVVLVDDESIGRTSRGNAATYLKFFDDIRTLFAGSAEAKIRGLSAGDFSFNRAGGRCEVCEGTGYLRFDMQFLPEARITCSECHGQRYQSRILDVKYRGLSIVEVLDLSAREGFSFFRGEIGIQQKLKVLKDVGLDYLPIGQPLSTLSGGEAQRLKLASYLTVKSNKQCLFILEEPTTGLHPRDVERLTNCLNALVEVGHSIIAVEHNMQFLASADHLIELGPGAGDEGGTVIANGPPSSFVTRDTATGRELQKLLNNR
ncbi:excinuclease ABC subunit UvrA [bacterium]|nr:excinuclease ABC subunit UvrA [bacterium]